jgi:Leucine-rich repeat (LRR) protein
LKNASPDSIFAIDLKKLNLTELPEELFRFTKIKYLDISKNKFANVSGLENFPKLRHLNIEKNKLEYFPISICQLTNIETLILNRNEQISNIPSCIEYCQQLKFVDLWGTAVTGLPEEMTRINTLEKIDFSDVQINKQGQERLKAMFPNVKLELSPPCNCTK